LLGVFLFPIGLIAQEVSIKVGTTSRQMLVYAPSGIEQNRPLVISMHGRSQTMYDQKNQTQFESVARDNNFVLVYPNAIDKSWQLWGTTDVDFILAIIDEMYNRYKIDRDRVYLSGFSMGGMMTYYAATQIADKIAAFAPVTGFLMGGPNTNSSRPIPIIHVHGEGDDFVPYSRVQECMDAWITRNGCPTTPVVTKPYPTDKPASLSSKKYWGPGKEGVEIVFLSLAGIGHWYSDDPNAVFTSREIWDFCKKYSLKNGVPEFKYASIINTDPKQIQVSLSKSIADSSYFKGFTVKIDNQAAIIDSVVLADTSKLVIHLKDGIKNSNSVTLSYSNGNVVSVYGKKLTNFSDTLVDNLLKGASPRLIEFKTNVGGDSLLAKFNLKMQIPSDVSALTLSAEYNGQMSIPVLQCSFFKNDSTILAFPLGKQVYRDYKILLSYLEGSIVSADNGLLKTISDFLVTNMSNGLPVNVKSGKIEADGITLSLEFSKPMILKEGQSGDFALEVNGKSVTFKGYSVTNNTIQLILPTSVHFGDTVTITYVAGKVTAADSGPLEAFSDFSVLNNVGTPVWINIPGKIEAENYSFKSGMQTETTSDTGGGQNLGYIGNGDWVEYAIENNRAKTDFQIDFRLASQSGGGIIDFYIDGKSAGRVTAPNTGNWQVYQSVSENITINEGKHYLKIVATSAGFNLNYMEVHETPTATTTEPQESELEITIYPNPVTNKMIIRSGNFRHSKIEVFNATGNLVMSQATAGEPVLHVPVHLPSGTYCVRISDGGQYQLKKIVVANK
jgi:uncharacterized repeat protein (TIGR02059 family)